MGERGILIDFGPDYDEHSLSSIISVKKKLEKYKPEVKLEVINTYNSLLISYEFIIEDVYGEISSLKRLIGEAKIDKKPKVQIFHLPVCYEEEFGLDLQFIAEQKGLEIEEIIRLHTGPEYLVYFIGFLPGFLYLGGLDEKLKISRKNTPRKSLEKGAVGIGENQTGIYPKSSPGGWQILGNCPVPLFDKNRQPPVPISPGDRVKLFSVSRKEYEDIKDQVEMGTYQIRREEYHG